MTNESTEPAWSGYEQEIPVAQRVDNDIETALALMDKHWAGDQNAKDLIRSKVQEEHITVTEHNFKHVVSSMVMDVVDHMSAFPDLEIDKEAWEHLLLFKPISGARRAENGTGAQETVAARVPEIDGLDETLSLIKTMKRILGEHKGSALWSTCFEGKLVWFSMKELMILESAARAYTELPKMQKVDLDEMKDTYKYATEELHRQAVGYNNAIDDIKSKYGDLYVGVK